MATPPDQLHKLKAQAHTLKPTVLIGKEGVTQAQLDTIKRHLDHHHLIKVRFNEHKDQKQQLSALIAEKTGSQRISLTGNTLTLYKAQDTAKHKAAT